LNPTKTSVRDFPDPHSEIHAVCDQIEHAVGEFHVDANFGMLGHESSDDRSDCPLAVSYRASQPDQSLDRVFAGSDGIECRFTVIDQLTAASLKQTSDFRQRNTSGIAYQEFTTEALLKPIYFPADL
jgi:hypothetical protein